MPTSSEYLIFALNVRKVTDSLIRLVEDGTPGEDFPASIHKVVSSLQGAGNKTPVRALRERGAFGRYEGVRTMNEVFPAPVREDLISKLELVIQPQPSQQRTDSALEAIKYFDALERRALYYYNRAKQNKRFAAYR